MARKSPARAPERCRSRMAQAGAACEAAHLPAPGRCARIRHPGRDAQVPAASGRPSEPDQPRGSPPGGRLFAVVQSPGSNDDRDLRFALKSALGAPAELVWHKAAELPAGTRAVLLPGGFSYGDYLRAGAMARHSPVMAAVRRFAEAGGPVLGICNGFPVLRGSGPLPGAAGRSPR